MVVIITISIIFLNHLKIIDVLFGFTGYIILIVENVFFIWEER